MNLRASGKAAPTFLAHRFPVDVRPAGRGFLTSPNQPTSIAAKTTATVTAGGKAKQGAAAAAVQRRAVKAVARTKFTKEFQAARALGCGFLENRNLNPQTRVQYEHLFKAFCEAQLEVLEWTDPKAVDEALVAFGDRMFFLGFEFWQFNRTVSAVARLYPQYGLQRQLTIPRTCRALRGWSKLSPAKSRPPLPKCAVAGLMALLLVRREPGMCLWVALAFVAYLRAGEAFGLHVEDLLTPTLGINAHWAVSLCPLSRGKASKTGIYDDTVGLDREDFLELGPALRGLPRPPGALLLFNFSYYQLRQRWLEATAALGLEGAVLHQLRHAGPSNDTLEQRRSPMEVMKRGRWKTIESVLRYEKAGLVAAEYKRLSPAAKLFCRAAEQEIPALLRGQLTKNLATCGHELLSLVIPQQVCAKSCSLLAVSL